MNEIQKKEKLETFLKFWAEKFNEGGKEREMKVNLKPSYIIIFGIHHYKTI